MTDTPRLSPAKQSERAAREARRAQALRENLRRRKEQQRARQAPSEPGRAETSGKNRAGEPPT